MKKTKILVFLGLLIAMDIILTHLLAFYITPWMRITFGFVPVSFSGALFGPVISGAGAIIADVLGATIFPTGGSFFFGFTLSALVTAAIYGLFLHKRPKTVLNITLAVLCVSVIVDLGMNTYWLSIMYGNGFFALLPMRLVKTAILLPVQVSIIFTFWKYAGAYIEKNFIMKSE